MGGFGALGLWGFGGVLGVLQGFEGCLGLRFKVRSVGFGVCLGFGFRDLAYRACVRGSEFGVFSGFETYLA